MCPTEWDVSGDRLAPPNPRPIQTPEPGADPVLVDHLRLDGMEFRVASELRLVTERSVWLLRPAAYFRIPKAEQPRPQDWSIEGRMDDCQWHLFRRTWFWIESGKWPRGHILPVAGPLDSTGIFTGRILAVVGTWAEVERESGEESAQAEADGHE